MSTPSSNQYFEAVHTGPGTPADPNLFSASEIVAGSFDSAAVSTATSKAVSTINAAAPDSTSISQARSQAVSAASVGSVADSKAVSDSVLISAVDSRATSNSVNTSIADSKAVSVAGATPVVTAIVYSGAISVADSKAVSSSTTFQTYRGIQTINVKDAPYLAVGNGVADDTAAILAADAAAAVAGGDLRFPSGTYKTSSNLSVARRWYGVPYDGITGAGTIIKPTAAVTKCLDMQSQGTLDGFYIDGVNTSGKTGIDVGTSALVNQVAVRNVQIYRFAGVGGRGFKVAQCVNGQFENIYADASYVNFHINGGGTPTTCDFTRCQSREATTKGWWVETGLSIGFHSILGEANGEEGFYLQNTGGTAIGIVVDGVSWFEANWQSVASGALRHAKYEFFCDGATGPSATIRPTIRDAYFNVSATTARAMCLTNALAYLVDNVSTSNEAGQFKVDGTSFGKFVNWPEQNGSFLTTVDAVAGSAWNSRSRLEDNIEAAWTTWTPVVTGSGAMTITALVISKARYKIIGKTMTVALTLSFTTATAGGQTVNITLPTGTRAFDALVNAGCLIADGAFYSGYIVPNGVNPTSSLQVGRADVANWSLGAGRQINTVFTFELF